MSMPMLSSAATGAAASVGAPQQECPRTSSAGRSCYRLVRARAECAICSDAPVPPLVQSAKLVPTACRSLDEERFSQLWMHVCTVKCACACGYLPSHSRTHATNQPHACRAEKGATASLKARFTAPPRHKAFNYMLFQRLPLQPLLSTSRGTFFAFNIFSSPQ